MYNNSVLVTDGRSKASVAIVRSLGKKKIDVTVGNDKVINPAFFSIYAKKRIIYPSPEEYPNLFLSRMYDLIRAKKYKVTIPVRDAATILFSKYKDKFAKFTKIPIPDYDIVMKCRDKGQTVSVAIDNNIPCPKTFIEGIHGDINKVISEFEFPVLVRPRESSGSRGIVYVDSPEKFIQEYTMVKSKYGAVMVQEYIPHTGSAYNVSALFNQYSEPRAVFVLKKIRQYPITGGPTAFAESVERSDVKRYALKLLKALNWYGVAEVEFLFDKRDKMPKLLEINPRFWDPLSLAIASGVDFPYLLYKMALEDDIEPVTSYRLGIKWRYFIYDILCFLSTDSKFKKLPEFFTFNNVNDAILSFNDPGPALATILDGFMALFNKKKRSHVFDRGW
ncbi:MAG: hypothetical protein DRP27_09660 [Thermotogae bacterium]|nr:MAG: hypothetical protein DRP27_09660 [Thermotogota bacterium]